MITGREPEHHVEVTVGSPASDGPAGARDLESGHARLEALVSEHFDFVWRLVRRFGVSRNDADDAAQQVFVTAMRRIDTIEYGRERAFLYGTALRVTANWRRGRERRQEDPEGALDAVESTEVPPDRRAELIQARELLDELLSRLPVPLRAMLVLVEIEELEVSAAAMLEGIPAGTAASRLRRARECFREELAKLGERHPFTQKKERGP